MTDTTTDTSKINPVADNADRRAETVAANAERSSEVNSGSVDAVDSPLRDVVSTETENPAVASLVSTVDRDELVVYLDKLLDVRKIKDASFNGLQVGGRRQVRRLVTGVTANKALIDAAIARNADAVLVHHGLFWKGDDPRLVGYQRERIAALLKNDLSLLAYHLPLDMHAGLGNNARLGRRLGLKVTGAVADNLVLLGELGAGVAVRAAVLAAYCERNYGPQVAMYASSTRLIRRVAWCTGAGGSLLREAIAAGADAFITGEISEHHIHEARESNVTLITAGHHATERDGVYALGLHLAKQFGIEVEFIDVPSPL